MLESQDINRGSTGHMRSGRVRTRQDEGIIRSIINNEEDDCSFPHDKKPTTLGYETADEEFTDIPGNTAWTTCMQIDTNSFKFVEQFEWPSSFSIIPQQRQKPKRKKNEQPPTHQKNVVTKQRAKAYTIDEMIQIARQTQPTPPTDLDEDVEDGEEVVLNDWQTQSSIASEDTTKDDAASVTVNSESYGNITTSSNESSDRGVGLITPLESDASNDESIGSAMENSTGLKSISVATNKSSTSRSQQSTEAGSNTMVLSTRSESHDWDIKWNFAPAVATANISPTAKTPRSLNIKNVHCNWDNRCGSPVKNSCDNHWKTTTSTTKNGVASHRGHGEFNERTRSCNETPTVESMSSFYVTPRRNSSGNTTSVPTTTVMVTPRRLQKLQEKSMDNARTTAESSTNPTSPCIARTRRLKSDTTVTAWSATIDRSPRVLPRHRSAGVIRTSETNIKTQTEPSRGWSIFDNNNGHFCTCTACASIVLQTSLQKEEFYKHQQRRCCRGLFEKEIAELVADINGFVEEQQNDKYDDMVIMARNSRSYSFRGDALLALANPLRELSLLCRDVRNIHAIRLFGGVQAVIAAMTVLRQQAHEHLQRRQRQKQGGNGTSTNTPSSRYRHSADDQCYSTALRDGCSVLQDVAREHAQSNSSSFAHRFSLVMLLSGGGSGANSNSGVHGIVQAMKLFPLDHGLQRTGTRALMNMSNSSRDACQAILDAAFSNDNDSRTGDIIAATAGSNGAGNELGFSEILEELVTVFKNFPHCPSIKESVLVTLCNLFEKVPDAAMKQLAPRRETITPPLKHEPVGTQHDARKRRPRPPKESKAVTHPPADVSTESSSQSFGELSSIKSCTATKTKTTQRTKIPNEFTATTPPTTAVIVSSPRAIVKVEDLMHLLDGVLRLGPKRHYHDARKSGDDDDDSEDDASALRNRVYRLEQRLLIGEVLENDFHCHPRLCFEDEKKCDI